MRKITKGQVKVYRALQNSILQHFVFGIMVFIVTFCVFAIHAWRTNPDLQSPLENNGEAFLTIFRESFIYTLLMGIPVYINFFLVYKRSLQLFSEKRYLNEKGIENWRFYAFLFLSSITALLFAYPLTYMIDTFIETIRPPYYHNLIVILLLIICTTGVSFVKDTIDRSRYWERKERQETIAKRKRLEHELSFIKKQIRPHFLFNTLQNLQILAKQKSDILPDLMEKLSKLLRYLLYRTNEKMVPLEQELDFIRSYVELEKIQLSSSTDFCFEVIGSEKSGQIIAPMILLIFVENCFKHYNKGSGDSKRIHILIEVENQYLVLNTLNTFKPHLHNENTPVENTKGGLGLVSVEENLRLIYKDRFQLKSSVENNQIYKTYLKLPLT